MKIKIFYMFLILLVGTSAMLAEITKERIDGVIIVKLHVTVQGQLLEDFIKTYSAYEFKEKMDLSYKDNLRSFTFNPKLISHEEFKEMLERDKNVIRTEFNYSLGPLPEYIPSDNMFWAQWALKNTGNAYYYDPIVPECVVSADIKATHAWDIISKLPSQNREITVAVFDVSFYMEHPDMNWDYQYAWNATDNNPNIPFYGNHGTGVSSVIGAKMNNEGVAGIGFNNKITVLPVHVGLGDTPNQIDIDGVLNAFTYVNNLRDLYNESGGTQGKYIVAINGSIPVPNSPNLRQRISEAEELGIITVFAAHNYGYNLDLYPTHWAVQYSTLFETLMTVTASSHRDERSYIEYGTDRLFTGNYGRTSVHLSAPAYLVRSCIWNPETGALYGSGGATSIATPHVTAVVGLLHQAASDELLEEYSENPKELSKLFKQYILEGTDRLPDFVDRTITEGRLNAFNAVKRLVIDHEFIREDTVLNNNLDLNRKIVIDDGATVSISNGNIYSSSVEEFAYLYGIEVRHGTLILDNVDINIPYLIAGGPESSIVFRNYNEGLINVTNIEIRNSAEIIIEDSEISFVNTSMQGYAPVTKIHINNSNINATNSQIGVFSDAHLIIEASELTMFDSIIRARYSAVIEVQNASFVTLSNNSSINVSLNCIVNVTSNSELLFNSSLFRIDKSHVTFDNAKLTAENNSNVFLINIALLELDASNFILTTGSVIRGHTRGYGIHTAPDYVWGDRMFINNNSTLDFALNSSIIGGNNGEIWDGLVFSNSRRPSTLRGLITGFRFLSITNNSDLNIISAYVHSIEHFEVLQSKLRVSGSEIVNLSSSLIIDDNSFLDMISTIVRNNGESGVFFGNSVQSSIIQSSRFYENRISGIQVLNSPVQIANSYINNNLMHGIFSISPISMSIYDQNRIENNLDTQIVARFNAFPRFYASTPQRKSTVSYANPPSHVRFLSAVGSNVVPINPPINVIDLNVDNSVPSRFLPSIDSFEFGRGSNSFNLLPETLFEEAINHWVNREYELANELFKEIVLFHSDTYFAQKSIAYLPYLNHALEGDTQELLEFLESIISNVTLEHIVKEIKGLTLMFNTQYLDAIFVYDEIIDNPPGIIEGLIAEINQAYCYLKLSEVNARNIPVTLHKPKSFTEYNTLQNDIIKKIMEIIDNNNISSTPPENFEIYLNNYPNPFNPETVIYFSNPTLSEVSIEIFNIRGQRIRLLVNEVMTAGNHEVLWNGLDDSGRNVASGVYLYKLVAGEQSLVRRMVLLK